MTLRSLLALLVVGWGAMSQAAEEVALPLTDWRVVEAVGEYGRRPLQRDPIEAARSREDWKAPDVGASGDPQRKNSPLWRNATLSSTGELNASQLRGGYAVANVTSPDERNVLLAASGHAAVAVNGQWHVGDPYALGWLKIPVQLQPGPNELLFHLASAKLSAKLEVPPAPYFFVPEDVTAPTLVAGDDGSPWAAIPITNATSQAIDKPILMAKASEGDVTFTPLASLGPLTTYKAPFHLPAVDAQAGSQVTYHLELRTSLDGAALAEYELTLPCVSASDRQTRTFVSRIDGAVQRYTLLPALPNEKSPPPGLLLALHGAGQSCEQFLNERKPLPWAHVVAPENRRPHGFDWEDWGATDAEEALADARRWVKFDPAKSYLVGHEMGGHGALVLASRRPDRFAAVGLSGAWLSYWTYGGMPQPEVGNPLEQALLRAAAPSDLLAGLTNLGSVGLYVRQGAANPRVAPSHGRFLRQRLGEFHPDFVYHEHAGDDNAGSVLGDWPALTDFVRSRQLAKSESIDALDFRTASPGAAAECEWARIENQLRPFEWSRLVLKRDSKRRTLSGSTENVSRMSLELREFQAGLPQRIELDGQSVRRLRPARGGRLWLALDDNGRWRGVNPPNPWSKTSHRSGGFKSVFTNNPVLVYGTVGDEAENAWAASKARFDAETFWCRGNGSLETLPDNQFDPAAYRHRNVVLYGNLDTNSAWQTLLSTSTIQLRRREAMIDVRREKGDDLAALFVQPKYNSPQALVGVVGGTGIKGFRAASRLRYFVAGIAYPDLLLFGSAALTEGASEVRVLGSLNDEWRVEDAELVWRDLAL